MNDDMLKGNWNQLKGRIKQQWGRLTDDDLDRMSGKRDEIIGTIQEKYGWARERAEMEVNDFLRDQNW